MADFDWGALLKIGGAALDAYGKKKSGSDQAAAGQQQNALAQFQAAQMRVNALDAQASAQIAAHDIQRQQDYATSRALAVAAASGGGASDPTVINLIARTAGEGAYRRSVALYEGKSKAQALNAQADATEYGGSLAVDSGNKSKSAYDLAALTTITKGATSLFSKYGGDGPSDNNTNSSTQSNTSNELF